MKKFTFLLLTAICLFCNNLSFAQFGIIVTVAGNGTGGFSGDGGTAILAEISYPWGVATDTSGNFYIADAGNNRIRKVSRSGIITTFAGNGAGGNSGDGGPATAAAIGGDLHLQCIATDQAGNMYLSTYNNLRKINSAGIINTIAGNGTYTNTGDGGPADSAGVAVFSIAVDASGNIYLCTGSTIRMINTSGIITTIAGTGITGFSGDGGPAIAAQFNDPRGIALDKAGNLYIADSGNGRIRMINTSGIINTIAGNGAGGSTGDCGPAILASLNGPGGVCVDTSNNIYILERDKVRMVNAANGLIRTIAGNGTGGYSGDNGPAPSAEIQNHVGPGIAVSKGRLYILDNGNNRIRKVSLNGEWPADDFSVNVNKLCSGGSFSFIINPYTASQVIRTYYGDGSVDSTTVSSGGTGYGIASATHSYSASGTYNIKHILSNAGADIDSISYSYEYTFCNVLPVKNFYDELGTCIYTPASDPFMTSPVNIEVDSNGVSIDTLSATAGFYYRAYGNPNDIYSFKLLSVPYMPVTCPSSGIIADTIISGTDSATTKYFGLSCGTATNFDLALNAIVPVTGIDDEWGHIFVHNNAYFPTIATVTVHCSSKYGVVWWGGSLNVNPAPTSYTSNSITWDLAALSATATTPIDLYYGVWSGTGCCGVLTPGDTVNSYYTVTPIIGDSNPTNNVEIIIDTVKDGCDPNEMWVSPQGSIPADTQLQYTINFDNTGNDTAFNIYIMDTISDNLNISSFRITSTSNVMNVTKLYDNIYHNIIRFDFPNINLLDSSHHGQCTGYVSFNINTKSGLTDGTTIFNWAGIFFDYNPVVMTNTVEDIVGSIYPAKTPSIKSNNNAASTVSIFPNPATTSLSIIQSTSAYTTFTITNSIGQNMMQQSLTTTQTQVNIATLPPGLYYITFRGDNGTSVQKFVKM